jgi:hypothetical protein
MRTHPVILRSEIITVLPSGEESIIASAGAMDPSLLNAYAHQAVTVFIGVHCALKVIFAPVTSHDKQKFCTLEGSAGRAIRECSAVDVAAARARVSGNARHPRRGSTAGASARSQMRRRRRGGQSGTS